MRGRFIRGDHLSPISDVGVDDGRSEFRRSLSGLEARIKDWSNRIDNGIIRGRLVSDISLFATSRQEGLLSKVYQAGQAAWEVKSNSDASKDNPFITVATEGGFHRGRLGFDISVGVDETATASNIAAYFNYKANLTVSSSLGVVTFLSHQYASPLGTMVFSDQPHSAGFTPVDTVPLTPWVDNVIRFSVADDYKKFAIGQYLRAGRTLLQGGSESSSAPPVLRSGRMKVMDIDSANNGILVDVLLPDMKGGDGLYSEIDNAVPINQPPSSRNYNYIVARADAPISIWRSPISPRIKSNTLYLRTENSCNVDLWVW